MHLKILIGVLTLGLAVASPKAAPKPAAKASAQYYSSGQQLYIPPGSDNFGQNFAAHSFPGQHSAEHYNVRLAPSSYEYSSGNSFSVPGYPQGSGNYYQSSQLIPVPVGYSSDPSAHAVQSANYYGAARLWPKNYVSPTGSPSPQVYYPSSTPSPISYQSTSSYGSSPFVRNYPISVSTPSPAQYPIPVSVNVDSRSSYQPEIGNYNAVSQNVYIPVSTPAPNLVNYQQYSTPASYVQSYQQPTATPYTAYQSTSAPSFAKYQQPTVAPYPVNYQQYSTPASYQVKYKQQSAPIQVGYQQHSTPAPFQVKYQQHSTPAPFQVKYQQYSTPAPFQVKYQQHSTPAPFQVKYQQYSTPAPYQGIQYSTVSPFAAYQQQPSASRYVGQYQTVSPSGANYYHQSTASPLSTQYQRIPVPVAYPQSQVQILPAKPTLTYPVSSTPVYPSVEARSQFVTTQAIPSSTPATILVSSTPTPVPKATIIKSEYNSGYVSPQYNHIPLYSTASTLASSNAYLPQYGKSAYGLSYAPAKSYSSYSPSTAVSHLNYNGLGHSYSY